MIFNINLLMVELKVIIIIIMHAAVLIKINNSIDCCNFLPQQHVYELIVAIYSYAMLFVVVGNAISKVRWFQETAGKMALIVLGVLDRAVIVLSITFVVVCLCYCC